MADLTPGTRNSAKISIKEICQKFESGNINLNSAEPNTPVPPSRKHRKGSLDISSQNGTKTEDSAFFQRNQPRRLSVKETTKLFELNCANDTASAPLNNKTEREQSTEYEMEKPNSGRPVIPPAKPPRLFNANESACSNVNFLINNNNTPPKTNENDFTNSKSKRFSNENPLNNLKYAGPGKLSKANSEDGTAVRSFESPIELNIAKNRLSSAPEITTNFKKQAKAKVIRTRLKNFSNNIVDKIKVFVDLTPTTVSPPRNYGTLKKCHSDEHIYAEIGTRASPSKKDESLHYMSIPVSNVQIVKEKSPSSRQSVRNMIYDSFAAIRAKPKENTDLKIPNDVMDSDVSLKAIEARITYVQSVRQIYGSSMCLSPKLYEALYMISVINGQPEILHSFPLKVPEVYKYPLLPHICFPNKELFRTSSIYKSDTFYFTLLEKGEKLWGYCLRISGWPNKDRTLCAKLPLAICIFSHFNAPLFYRKLLAEIEKHLVLTRAKCFKYIRSLQKLGIPNVGASVSIPDYTECTKEDRVVITRPLDAHTVGSELTRTLYLLDVDILTKVVASLLLERRVLLFSSSQSNLYCCCQAILSLLYPFEWPHTILPVLPQCLTVNCCSELPYVIGTSSGNFQELLELLAEQELLIINVDKGIIIKSYGDEDTILPKKIQKAIVSALNLAKNMTDPTEMMRDMMISEAFTHTFVEMVGHYENYISEQNGSFTFQKESFVRNSVSYSVQSFLQWFSETQMFDTFINESIWRIQYKNLCQTNQQTFFEKRVDEYKWQLAHDGEKFSRFIEKTVRNFGEMIFDKLKK